MQINLTKEEVLKAGKDYDAWLEKKLKYMQDENIAKIMSDAKGRGYMTKDDLEAVAIWKDPRIVDKCEKNSDTIIQKTKIALADGCDEKVRIETLKEIDGVGWAMASVILHFAFPKEYPIVDIRAMTTVGGVTNRDYNFDIWWEYTLRCREYTEKHNITMRQLDKALWMTDKQKKR